MSEGKRGRLIIVCGLPGAGKTTHAKRLEASGPVSRTDAKLI